MRPLIKTLIAVIAIMTMTLPAVATGNGGHGLECPGELKVPVSTVIHDGAGSEHVLQTVNVLSEFHGTAATVSATAENQSSVHPGNNLVVASGGTEVVLEDVERAPGVTTPGSGELTLGSTITITLVMGDDEVFSAGIMVSITCEEPEPVETSVSVGGECEVVDGQAVGLITGNVGDGLTLSVAGSNFGPGNLSINVDAPGTYPWSVTVGDGYINSGGESSGEILIEDCTPETPEETTTTEPEEDTTTTEPEEPVEETTSTTAPATDTTVPVHNGDTRGMPTDEGSSPAGMIALFAGLVALACAAPAGRFLLAKIRS